MTIKEKMKELLLRDGVTPEEKQRFRDNFTKWETKFTGILDKAKDIDSKSKELGKINYLMLQGGVEGLIEHCVTTREVFEEVGGYDDMVKMVQDHIDFLIAGKRTIDNALGNGTG